MVVVLAEIWNMFVSTVNAWLIQAAQLLPNLAVAVLLLVIGFLVAKGIEKGVRTAVKRSSKNNSLARFLGTLTRLGVLALFLVLALGVLNLQKTVTSLLAGAGIIGLALGFAFQDIAANFIAGVVILLQKPFKRGDMLSTNDFEGVVEQVSIRTTQLKTFTGQQVLIPNKDIFENPLVNFSVSKKRRVDMLVGVAYNSDLDTVEKVTVDTLKSLKSVRTNEGVEVLFTEFGGSSINLVARFWMDFDNKQAEYLKALSEAIRAVKAAYDKEGINIPFPIRTLEFADKNLFTKK